MLLSVVYINYCLLYSCSLVTWYKTEGELIKCYIQAAKHTHLS